MGECDAGHVRQRRLEHEVPGGADHGRRLDRRAAQCRRSYVYGAPWKPAIVGFMCFSNDSYTEQDPAPLLANVAACQSKCNSCQSKCTSWKTTSSSVTSCATSTKKLFCAGIMWRAGSRDCYICTDESNNRGAYSAYTICRCAAIGATSAAQCSVSICTVNQYLSSGKCVSCRPGLTSEAAASHAARSLASALARRTKRPAAANCARTVSACSRSSSSSHCLRSRGLCDLEGRRCGLGQGAGNRR